MSRFRLNLDILAVCAATLCSAHCLLYPLLVVALPFLTPTAADIQDPGSLAENTMGSSPSLFMTTATDDGCCTETNPCTLPTESREPLPCCDTTASFWTHFAFLAIGAPLGFWAWINGFAKHNIAAIPLLGGIGLILLSLGLVFGNDLLGGQGERLMTLGGCAFLVIAHLWNRMQCHCSNTKKTCAKMTGSLV